MTNIYEQEIAYLKDRIEKLEALLSKEVARVDKRITDCEEGTCGYIDDHRDEHREIMNMVYPAYYKTHPGYLKTLIEAENIIGKTCDDGSDPQT